MTAGGHSMTRDQKLLHAYRDGELGWWARWRFERRLARSAELRRELGALARLGEWAREADSAGPDPDLWSDLAPRLPALDAQAEPAAGFGFGEGLLRPALGVAAAAALVVAVAVGLRDTGPTPVGPPPSMAPTASLGVVRWIDPGEKSVLVLENESDATIIWVLDSGDGSPQGEGRDVV